jgi:hypothetical protein
MKFDFNKFLAVVAALGPVVLSVVPGGGSIAPLIPTIVGAIVEAEAIKGATGAEKKAHVLNVVEAAVSVANATGKVTLKPEEVQGVASLGIDTVISTIHVIEGAKVVKS